MKIRLFKNWISQKLNALRFRLSATNSPLFIGYYTYLYRPEKGSISEFLDSYSRSLKGKLCVVQIGANDGITHDPIHKFIKRDSWNGVLLEPQPFVHRTYLSKIYAKNEGIHTLCAALGEKDSTQKLYKIAFSTMRWATGLASFQLENVQKAFESDFVASRCEKYGIPLPANEAEQIDSEEVRVISPQTLMKDFAISQIDLLQIDCEGFDYEVIKIFDIVRTKPAVIIFENSHIADSAMQECRTLFRDNDYRIKTFGPNTLAIKNKLLTGESTLSSLI